MTEWTTMKGIPAGGDPHTNHQDDDEGNNNGMDDNDEDEGDDSNSDSDDDLFPHSLYPGAE